MNGLVRSVFAAASPRQMMSMSVTSMTRPSQASAVAAVSASSIHTSSTSSSSASNEYYTVGITGASGLVGTALVDELLNGRQSKSESKFLLFGKPVRVVQLVRGDTAQAKFLEQDNNDNITTKTKMSLIWNPKGTTAEDIIHPDAAAELDAIVHLSGENVSTNIGLGPLNVMGIRPWTEAKKKEIIDSRVITTTALSKVIAASAANNNNNNNNNDEKQPMTFLSASGVGVYGDKFIGNALPAADESQDVANVDGFLAQVSREWEAATDQAKSQQQQKNARVVNMRFGVTMSKQGGALQKLYPIFLLGGGGRIGSGEQYFTFISARDLARAIVHCLETTSMEGPVNMCAPNPCTNLEFTKAMGSVLHRPTILPFPGFAVKTLFGQMGEEMLLGGVRAVPGKLVESGFEFLHPTIEDALASAMEEDI